MDNNELLTRSYFGGVTEGDYFPRGKRIGIYIPDWDSVFILTPKGKKLMACNKFIITQMLCNFSVKSRAIRLLKMIDNNMTMHKIFEILGNSYVHHWYSQFNGEYAEWDNFTMTITWMLRNGYILRVIDRSIE